MGVTRAKELNRVNGAAFAKADQKVSLQHGSFYTRWASDLRYQPRMR